MIINLQQKAKADLEDIYEYTYKKWGVKQADQYLDTLDEGIQALISNPKIGKDASTVRLGYRKLQIEHHVVFYKINIKEIRIFRILHQSMDAESHI